VLFALEACPISGQGQKALIGEDAVVRRVRHRANDRTRTALLFIDEAEGSAFKNTLGKFVKPDRGQAVRDSEAEFSDSSGTWLGARLMNVTCWRKFLICTWHRYRGGMRSGKTMISMIVLISSHFWTSLE
jgi:hypothetical protein